VDVDINTAELSLMYIANNGFTVHYTVASSIPGAPNLSDRALIGYTFKNQKNYIF